MAEQRDRRGWLAAIAFAIVCPSAGAQPLPPFFGPATLFDPEISVVNSGVVQDMQAVVVGPDARYVTINARPTLSRPVIISQFTFQRTAFGFVGGVNPTGAPPPTGSVVGQSAAEVLRRNAPSPLERPGVTRLAGVR